MVFTSTIFLILFLPIVLTLYFLLPKKYRNLFLFLASLFFYAWGEVYYSIVLLISIGLNCLLSKVMAQASDGFKKRCYLILTVILNLGLLGWFKYANFIVDNLNVLMATLNGPTIQISRVHLPIGISFFTFQALSYVIDVYRGKIKASKRLINLALYISLFPQLLSGPIVRYQTIAGEMDHRTVNLERFAYGIRRFVIGMGKKMLLANSLGEVADQVFSLSAGELSMPLAWFGAACYTLQIYFDFSGYSDMAIGLARMLGFTYLENFDYPYISQSIREFWRRWHISLSTWFRDYVYIPLGGNRYSHIRTLINLWIVFVVCGLWHGASWTFVIWGALHGLFMVFERAGLEAFLYKIWRPLRHGYALLVIIVAWVFFRAETFYGALSFLSAMFGLKSGKPPIHVTLNIFSQEKFMIFAIAILAVLPWLSIYEKLKGWLRSRLPNSLFFARSQWPSWLSYGQETMYGLIMVFIFLLSLMQLAAGTYRSFIYFRF